MGTLHQIAFRLFSEDFFSRAGMHPFVVALNKTGEETIQIVSVFLDSIDRTELVKMLYEKFGTHSAHGVHPENELVPALVFLAIEFHFQEKKK